MPLYRYGCSKCGAARDEFRPVNERHDAPECHGPMALEIMPTHVQPDIAPYRAAVLDVADKGNGGPPLITGRRAHKEFLKRNRLVEVGDRPITDTKRFRPIHDERSRRDLREQMRPIVAAALRKGSHVRSRKRSTGTTS